jgi:zinc transporter 1/2/3
LVERYGVVLTSRFAKYFGSGVIIATAFIHLLAPAFEELGSECLSGAWTDYSWAPAIAIFFAEVAAYRIGTKKLAKLGVNYSMSHLLHGQVINAYWTDAHHEEPHDAHAHAHQGEPHAHAHGEDSPTTQTSDLTTLGAGQEKRYSDLENKGDDDDTLSVRSQAEAAGQLVGVAVLEFGVVLHR